MTPYQAMIWCAEFETLERLTRWRMMEPAVRKKAKEIEGKIPSGS